MPAALERALKRRASKLGLGKERKDAYVYGTLRKTGWKPSHQMNTNERVIRLAAIDDKLESLVQFQYYDDQDDRRKFPWGKTAAAGGAVGGGYLLNRAVQRTGGWGANLAAGRSAFGDLAAGQARFAGGGPGAAVGSALGKGVKAVSPALAKLKGLAKPLLGRLGLESNTESITMDETLLEPFQGSSFKSKIEEEQFPAGLSPLAAMRLPFPELMRYLNRRDILRQVFSSKHERLIQLNSKLDEIKFISYEEEETGPYGRKDRSGKTWKGAAVAGGFAAAGYGGYRGVQVLRPVDRYRAGMEAIQKARARSIGVPFKKGEKIIGVPTTRAMIRSGYKAARYARLSARVDGLIEFQLPEKLKEKIKEKFGKKKKGRVSHGGGT